MPGRAIGATIWRSVADQAGAVDLGGLEHLHRHLGEERPHHPDRDRQVHRGVEDDQRARCCRASRRSARTGRSAAAPAIGGSIFVDRKKNITSVHFSTGWMDRAYAAGMASSSTRSVETTLAVGELISDGQG